MVERNGLEPLTSQRHAARSTKRTGGFIARKTHVLLSELSSHKKCYMHLTKWCPAEDFHLHLGSSCFAQRFIQAARSRSGKTNQSPQRSRLTRRKRFVKLTGLVQDGGFEPLPAGYEPAVQPLHHTLDKKTIRTWSSFY